MIQSLDLLYTHLQTENLGEKESKIFITILKTCRFDFTPKIGQVFKIQKFPPNASNFIKFYKHPDIIFYTLLKYSNKKVFCYMVSIVYKSGNTWLKLTVLKLYLDYLGL
jgi:hypothetical protein